MKIFLSSTYTDLVPERQAVEKVIVALGQNFVGMEYFFSHEEDPLETCLAEVAQSQLMVLVVGQRYGSTDDKGVSSTEREYLCAGEHNIPRFVFLKDDAVDAPRDMEPERQAGLKRFRSELMAHHALSFFKNPDELATQVALTLARELLKQLPSKRGLLPLPPPENFVGRAGELNDLQKRLRENGMVGIAGVRGVGGIGKSALATVFAYTRVADYPDGLLWAPLAGRDPMLVLSDLAKAYGEEVKDYADLPGRAARVRAILDGKHALLILDDARKEDLPNLPHFKMRCPTLVTTRLLNLSLVPARAMLSLEVLSEEAALQLCREVLGERADKEQNGLRAFCHAAGYLPLALNILLRRLYENVSLGAQTLSERVADRKRAIKEVSQFDDPNLNVHASFDLSYDALKPDDQRVFRALAVFDGPDFQAPLVADILQLDPDDARDVLERLVEYALAARAEGGRFRLHPLLQSYAQELLTNAGEEDAIRQQAAAAYVKFSRGRWMEDGWNELEVERDNIFGVLEWCHAHQLDSDLIVIVPALREFMRTRGYWEQNIFWHERMRAAAERSGDKTVWAGALLNVARTHIKRGDYVQARTLLEQSQELYKEKDDRRGQIYVLHELGSIELEQGNYTAARSFLEQQLVVYKEIEDKQSIATTLHQLGSLEFQQGNYATARSFLERTLAIDTELGNKRGRVPALHALGVIELQQGNYVAARDYFEQSLTLAKELGDKQGTAATLREMGLIAANQADYAAASPLYKQGLALEKELENKKGIARTLQDLGSIEFLQGNYGATRTYYEQSLALEKELGDKQGITGTLQTLGMLDLQDGNLDTAEKDFQEGLSLAQQIGSKYWIAFHQYSLAYIAAYKGNHTDAIELAQVALVLWEELHAPEAEAARKLLAQLRGAAGE